MSVANHSTVICQDVALFVMAYTNLTCMYYCFDNSFIMIFIFEPNYFER